MIGRPPFGASPFLRGCVRQAAAPRLRREVALVFAVALVAAAAQSAAAADPWKGPPAAGGLTSPLVFTQVPVQTVAGIPEGGAAPGLGPDLMPGSRIVSFDPGRPDQGVTNLTGGFSAAGKPDVSFDGKRILFVAKRSWDDPFDVWEMNADGSDLRRITRQVGDCRAAIYLSPIFTIDAPEPVEGIAFCSDPMSGAGPSLYTCRMDGTRVRPITFDPFGATDPCLLSDSRLLFCSGQRPGPRHDGPGGTALLTVNTDGTDVFVFAAAHEAPARRGMPCETADGWVVYVESVGDSSDRGGSLVAVSRTASLRTRREVAGDDSGLYCSPSAIADGHLLLVSYRPRGSGSYGIYVLDPVTGARTASVYDAPEWHDLDAVVVGARARPAGRSSVVDERVETGLLYCLDANLSNTAQSRRLGEARIKWLQVFKAVTDQSPRRNDTTGEEPGESRLAVIREELLGTVPVESDGSFHLSVPARTSLRLQTLDPDGQVLQAMRSWIWVMPKESRGCIGCHEDRELSPPNRHPLALRKPPRPVGVTDTAASNDDAPRQRTKGSSR
jgi:hypothetical protein